MKWRKFDKKVNDELSGHQSDVDIDALWGAIEPEVDAINAEKKKRRRGVFWWFFGGLLLIGIGAAYLFFSQNEATQVADFKNKNEATEQTDVKNFAENEAANFDNKNIEVIDEKTDKTTNLNTKKQAVSNFKNEISTPDIAENQSNVNAKKLDGNEFLNEKLNQNENAAFAIDNLNEKTLPSASEKNAGFEQKSVAETEESRLLNGANSVTFSNQDILPNDKNQLVSLSTKGLEEINYPFVNLTRQTLTEAKKQAIEQKIKEENTAVKTETDKEEKANKSFNFAASLQTGVSLANRNLSVNGDTTELAKIRRNTEKNLETFQLGLQLHWQQKKTGLELTSGINYTQINEKFEYKVNEITVDSIFSIESFYRNVNGDTIANMGMIPQTTTFTIHKRHFNKYRMIDVPILLGYRKRLNKFSIGAQAGVFVNLKLQASGRFFNAAMEDIYIKEQNIFKANVGLSYYLGATVDYHLNENWSVSAAPYVRHFPNNFAKASYGLEQKYTLYGVNLGLRYSF